LEQEERKHATITLKPIGAPCYESNKNTVFIVPRKLKPGDDDSTIISWSCNYAGTCRVEGCVFARSWRKEEA